MLNNRRTLNWLGALACTGLIAYAYYAEWVLKLAPCPLCMFQRVAIVGLGIVFLLAALHHPGWVGARVYGALMLLAGGAAMYVAGRHVWIQAQPPGSVPACGAPLDVMLDMLPFTEVLRKVLTGGGECGNIDWQLLGVSMPGWVLITALALTLFGAINQIWRRAV
jgi:disulfide bond formation protein DsbB